MFKIIDLKIYSPTELLLDEEVKKFTFVGKEGYLTMLPNHIDYVSSFETNIASYINVKNEKKFVVLSDGILVKYANKIRINTYKAIFGNTMEELKIKIDKNKENENDIEKEINKNLKKLEYYMFNNLVNIK